MADTNETAFDIISKTLSYYGLDDADLMREVQALWMNKTLPANASIDDIGVQLQSSPAFAKRFPANKILADQGKPQYSVSQYLRLESDYKSRLQAAGMPTGFYDNPQDFQKFIANDVSPDELSARLQYGYQAVRNAPKEVVDQFKTLYGVSEGDLAAYFIDPEAARPTFDRYEAERQARSAAIAAEAATQANIQLGRQQAEELARAGVSTTEAQKGFGVIGTSQELFTTQAGEEAISQQEQITGVLGTNAAAAQRVAKRRRERQAQFEQGGTLATTQQGVTGLRTVGQ